MQAHAIALGLCGILAGGAAIDAQTRSAEPSSTTAHQTAPQQTPATDSKLTFKGDTALWTVAIRPDKTADFERVILRLREALMKSSDPVRQRQAQGWKVVRLTMPLPDGSIGYVHVVNPVVPGADYTVMQILYDAFPDERQMLYELYRGAFASNLALATGNVVIDLGSHASPAPGATPAPSATTAAPTTTPTSPPTPTSSSTPTPPATTTPER